MKIETKDTEGRLNGYILTCWNANDNPELRPDQVYVTAIAPHSRKGPHKHLRRRGLFVCLTGKVLIQVEPYGLDGAMLKPGDGPFVVAPGMACALYNYGDTEALVLNMPSPAWSREDPDDHPVLDWKDPEDWPQPVKHTCPACHGTGNHDLTDGGCINCGGKGSFYAKA